jgi:hypothetical protein
MGLASPDEALCAKQRAIGNGSGGVRAPYPLLADAGPLCHSGGVAFVTYFASGLRPFPPGHLAWIAMGTAVVAVYHANKNKRITQ